MSNSALIDHLLSHTSIRVSAGADHSRPLELFYPKLRSYEPFPLRAVPSDAARDGYAVVQDKDIVATWRLPSAVAAYEVFF